MYVKKRKCERPKAVKEELADMPFNPMVELLEVEQKTKFPKKEIITNGSDTVPQTYYIKLESARDDFVDTCSDHLHLGKEYDCTQLSANDVPMKLAKKENISDERDTVPQVYYIKLESASDDFVDYLPSKKLSETESIGELSNTSDLQTLDCTVNCIPETEKDVLEELPAIGKVSAKIVRRWQCTLSADELDGYQSFNPGPCSMDPFGDVSVSTTSGVPTASAHHRQHTAAQKRASSKRRRVLRGSSTSNRKTELTVHRATNFRKSVYKKNSCKFCDMTTKHFCKHLFSKKHRSEPEVVEILSKSANCKERAFLLEKIRNEGNYRHNCRVLQNRKGELIPCRSPSELVDPCDYVPCTICLGFFHRSDFWRHQAACKFRTDMKKGRRIIGRAESLLPSVVNCSQGFRENILGTMNSGSVKLIAKHDPLIVMYGEQLYEKHRHIESRANFVRQRIRDMAYFLIQARVKDTTVSDLESCLKPCKFWLAVSVVNALCGFDSVNNTYAKPSLALKLGRSLKKCADMVRNQALLIGDETLQTEAADFMKMCERDWKGYFSLCTLSILKRRKMIKLIKPRFLSLTEDLLRLTRYLQAEKTKQLLLMRSTPTLSTWRFLAKVCLADIRMFNRHRRDGASRMLISDYEAAKSNTVLQDNHLAELSLMEKHFGDKFMRVIVRVKGDSIVPVLLTKSMQEEIDELLLHRQKVGVSPGNKYVFAQPYFHSVEHLPGHSCLNEAVKASAASHPQTITCSKLRKHVATVYQIVNFDEHELKQVCGFLGHAISVRHDFCCLPQNNFQLAKVSRLLMAVEQGQIEKFMGKSFEDIHFEEEDLDSHGSRCDMSKSTEVKNPDSQPLRPKSVKATERRNLRHKDSKPASTSKGTFMNQKKRDFLTEPQIELIRKHFRNNIESFTVPRKHECEALIQKEHLLKSKSWVKIKCTVRNEIEKKRREVKRIQASEKKQ